jgi:ABC-2 type transport system permease protein
VLAKDLRLGPRSPVFLWVLALPVVFTFLIGAVFGDLFAPPARLAVVDEGPSRITAALQDVEGIEVTVLDDLDAMAAAVESHDYDAGLYLPAGTDEALASGQASELELLVSGQSLASTRLVIGVTTLDELRAVAGTGPPVEVVVTTVGDQDWVPVEDRMLPLIVMYAVVIAGVFLPASSMVEERERRTLDAVLITPVRMSEVLVGKGALGVVLAVLMGWVTLALNSAFGSQPLAMTLFLLLGGVMMAEVGLVVGSWAKDSNTLFTTVKGGALLVVAPVLFTLFPSLPQWIAQLFPTYYFLQPIYDMAVSGTTFSDHLVDLAACVAICLALLPAVAAMGRRLEQQMAATV